VSVVGLGAAAAMVRHRVTSGLVDELVEAADRRVLSRTIARYGAVHH
jgi:hypothetical protein